MPLPSEIISVSLFLCERLLEERDGVTSAIRIVDVFPVPRLAQEGETPPQIVAWGCLIIKAKPGSYLFSVEFKIVNPEGIATVLGPPVPIEASPKDGAVDIPVGAAVGSQLNISVTRYGTYYYCAYIEGEEASRVPFTILQQWPLKKSD